MKKLLVLLLSSTLCFNNAFLTVQALEDDPAPSEEPSEDISEDNEKTVPYEKNTEVFEFEESVALDEPTGTGEQYEQTIESVSEEQSTDNEEETVSEDTADEALVNDTSEEDDFESLENESAIDDIYNDWNEEVIEEETEENQIYWETAENHWYTTQFKYNDKIFYIDATTDKSDGEILDNILRALNIPENVTDVSSSNPEYIKQEYDISGTTRIIEVLAEIPQDSSVTLTVTADNTDYDITVVSTGNLVWRGYGREITGPQYIVIEDDFTPGNVLTNPGINVKTKNSTDEVIIDGKGHSIYYYSCFLRVTKGTVILKNVNLRGGSERGGGPIYCTGGELTIEDSTITTGASSFTIGFFGDKLILSGNSIISNTYSSYSGEKGDGVRHGGSQGDYLVIKDNATIRECAGNGIYIFSYGSLRIEDNASICDNKGYGVYGYAYNFLFSGGSITRNDGGIYVLNQGPKLSGNATVKNNTISGNETNIVLTTTGSNFTVNEGWSGEVGVTLETPLNNNETRIISRSNLCETGIVKPDNPNYYTGFDKTKNSYFLSNAHFTISWTNYDETVLETDENIKYGVLPEYNGSTPEKEEDAQYSYTFIGWDPEVSEVTGNTEYTATFSGNVRSYSIKWLDDNGEELKTETVEYGETPVPPADPTKEATDQYEYTFTGWDPAVTAVTGEAIYSAKYSETLRYYTVTWKNWDGTVLKTEKSDYGSTPKYTGSTPEKAEDATYTYTFKGWTPDISEVTGDAEYTASYNRKEKIVRVIGVSLNNIKVTLEKTKTITLTATVKPDNATNKSVFWISSNPSVVMVDQNGKVTALKKGTAVITALSSADTTKKAECTVTVTVTVSGVKLNKTSLTLDKGKTSTLTATITPSDATNKKVTWSSSNIKVVTVDSNGKVTAKGAGTATITVKTADGGKTATCKVTVTVPVSGVKLNKTSLTLDKGKTSTLTATVSPSDASNKKVTWKSSNTKVATVDTKGKVTAKGAGTATITVKTADGGKTSTCKVTVKEPKPQPTKDPAACTTNGFCRYNGKDYWYEDGVRQGTSKDPQGVIGDGTVRGREVYDGETGAWYWLDAAYDGAKAVGKEVWMPYIYQDEASWKNNTSKMNEIVKAINSYSEGGGPTSDMGEQVRKAILNGDGKWVRYDENGKMMKGWVTINTSELIKLYPGQVGNTYFYDYTTGLMAKGWTTIGGTSYYFDETSGVLQQ